MTENNTNSIDVNSGSGVLPDEVPAITVLEENNGGQNNNDKENQNEEEEVITIDCSSPRYVSPENANANLDVEDGDDGCEDTVEDDDDGGGSGNSSGSGKSSGKDGVMRQVLCAVQERIKYEQSNKFPTMDRKWMMEYLKKHNWIIPRDDVPWVVEKLKLKHNTFLFKHYYTKLVVWMPHLQHGLMPCCVNCKDNSDVGFHGYPSHPGRMIVDLKENYYIMGCRYKCNACRREKERLKALAKSAAGAAAGVEVEVESVNLQTTFIGWDRRILPLFQDGIGKEFPAFLTKRAGVDNNIIDLMRPLFNKSIRPECFSDLLLELHTKEWTRRYILYEREVAKKDRLFPGFADTAPLFSDFSDAEYYDGHSPTGKYIAFVYSLYHDTISEHLAKEVKKRPTEKLYWDVSYKIDKRMNNYKGEKIFKGLVTGMNELGEIRIQFHIFTDSHEQMSSALEAFKRTNQKLGMEDPKYFVTDNPRADAAFVTGIFDTLRQQQQQLNDNQRRVSSVASTSSTPSFDEEFYARENVRVLSAAEEVNIAIAAMWDVAANKVVGLDAEWSVKRNRFGNVKKAEKVALIQVSYVDKDDKLTTLLVRTTNMSKLPHRLVSLLTGSTFKIVGVNVSADLIKIGKDFGVDGINGVTQKKRKNVINLGTFARKRDVVQDGGVSLKQLCEAVMNARLSKETITRLSDWDQRVLTEEQVKYAALDAIASLKIFFKLDQMPDLTKRFTMDDVTVGDTVDLVPMHGSVSCMATRAAHGIIADVDRCESPENVSPRFARAGKKTVIFKIVKIYSTAFKIPGYKHQEPGSQKSPATLEHFKEGDCIVVPVHMLKQHISSDKVRTTPTDTSTPTPSVTSPAEGIDPPQAQDTTRSVNDSEDFCEVVIQSLADDDFDSFAAAISEHEIELIRAAAEQVESTQPVRDIFPCEELSPSPPPTDIADVYSCVLGDAFHLMKRLITPMNHEAKKAFFVALRAAIFVWNEEKLEELKRHMMEEDELSEEDIENKMLFSPTLFTDCVDRYIPPPSLLYFRVRAVFVLFGNVKDSKSSKPLFDKKAWKSANNVLDEILKGYYSDPPGVQWYTKRLNKDGSVATNKYGMELLDCSRGTNRVESFHKDLISDWGSWPMGMEMSVKLLAEKRHRHNHRVSEKRREGFPKIGHYDTWEVDELQSLVLKNRGFLLYPHWSNASEYVTTEESFDVVALQSQDIQKALEARCQEISPLPKLTRELQFQCKAMGSPLPFLPFSTAEERMQFSTYIHNHPTPVSTIDAKKAAIDWCAFVDGQKIMPKLPCHIRTYIRQWEKNQRSKDLFMRAKSGREKLAKLNSIKLADPPINKPIPLPPAMAQPQPGAMHNQQYTIVGNGVIGDIPLNQGTKRKKGQRGKDKGDTLRKPRKRRCRTCLANNGAYFETCPGRSGRGKCQHYPE